MSASRSGSCCPRSEAVLVTTPQLAAQRVASRAAQMVEKLGQPLIGVIENMSSLACPCCGEATYPFGRGGGAALAEQLGVPLLGEVPLEDALREGSDSGAPIFTTDPDAASARAIAAIAQRIAATRPRARRAGAHLLAAGGRQGLMRQSVSLVTLGVADYGRAKAFYQALGWTLAMDIEETAFFQANGVVLVLWARDKLAADSGVADDGSRWGGVTLAHNVGSRDEVHAVDRRGARRRSGDRARAGRDVLRRLRGRFPRPRRPRLGSRPQSRLRPGRRRQRRAAADLRRPLARPPRGGLQYPVFDADTSPEEAKARGRDRCWKSDC